MSITRSLNMDPHIPIYYQLTQLFRQQIDEGQFQPGDVFYSENELCEKFGVSRPTVRQAINELVREGLLHRVKGKGTYVSAPKIQQDFIQKLMSFPEEMQHKGLSYATVVLNLDVMPSSKAVSAHLALGLGESVYRLDRLRLISNEPIVIVTSYLAQRNCPDLSKHDLANNSLYDTLEKHYGIRVCRARRILEVESASDEDAKLLNIEEGDPLQLSRTVAWNQFNKPVEFSIARYRGDRSEFTIELYR